MHPILFHWRGITIYSYTVAFYTATVCALIVVDYFSNLAILPTKRVLLATLCLLIAGMTGARLLHILIHREFYRLHRHRLWRRSSSGGAQLGGLLLMLIVSVPLLKILQIPWLRYWDVAVIGLLTGLAFAKFGCLLHGCCCGKESSSWLAIRLPDHSGNWKHRVPSQPLESGLSMLLIVVAIKLWYTDPKPGTIFLVCALLYSVGRIALQAAREIQDIIGTVNVQVALSIVLATGAAVGLVIIR